MTEYSASVENSVTSLTVNAKAAESGATVSVSGNTNLRVGANYVIVKVTAPSGATKQYNITVTRQAAGASSQAASSRPASSAGASSAESVSEPLSSEPEESSGLPASSDSAESTVSEAPSEPSSAEETELSSQTEDETPAPDLSGWVIHAAYIGGMIVCLLLGCMIGYYIRGRKES